MQFHLEANELNLLANLLMQQNNAGRQNRFETLLEMVLAHDLRFDSDDLELLANLLAGVKTALKADIAQEADRVRKATLEATLTLLQRVEERVNEACVMI